jgi:hypothetical protein
LSNPSLPRREYRQARQSWSGEESESSDVDILIVGNVREEMILKTIGAMEEKAGREINYIFWSDGEFKKRARSKHHLLTEIARKPVIMLIGEESEFRRAAKKQGHKEN